MAKAKQQLMEVDAGALRSLLAAQGTSVSKLAVEMGYANNWINLKKGLQPAVVSYIKAVYKILPEQYQKRNEAVQREADFSVQRHTVEKGFISALDKPDVRSYFVQVVRRAIDDCLREDKEKIKAIVKEAIEEALK